MGTIVLREVVPVGEGVTLRISDTGVTLHDMLREMIGINRQGMDVTPRRYEIVAYYPELEANNVRNAR